MYRVLFEAQQMRKDPGISQSEYQKHLLGIQKKWACCTTLATAVAAKIAVATVAERRQVGRDSLHCTTR